MEAFQTSPETDKLDEALAKAQGKIKAAKKDSKNPHFGSSYADLASVFDAARGPLAEEGISVTQWLVASADPGVVSVVTRIAHKGQWIRSLFTLPVAQRTPQGFGSATTYAKRYAFGAAICIAAEEDDDGNAASDAYKQAPAQERRQDAQRQQQGNRGRQQQAPAQGRGQGPKADKIPLEQALKRLEQARTVDEVEDVAKLLRTMDWSDAEKKAIAGMKEGRLTSIANGTCPECRLKAGEHETGCPELERLERLEREKHGPGADG